MCEGTICQNGSDDEDRIKNIADAFKITRYFFDIDKPEERGGKKVTQFSDSIVISFPMNEESGVFNALLEILWVQINLVHFGMLCLGAVMLYVRNLKQFQTFDSTPNHRILYGQS